MTCGGGEPWKKRKRKPDFNELVSASSAAAATAAAATAAAAGEAHNLRCDFNLSPWVEGWIGPFFVARCIAAAPAAVLPAR